MAEVATSAPKTADPEHGIEAKKCVVNVDYPELTLTQLVERWGAETCQDLAVKQATIDLQANVRRMLEQGSTVDEIVAWVKDEWTPGTKAERVSRDPAGAVKRNLAALDPAQRKALLEEMIQSGMIQ